MKMLKNLLIAAAVSMASLASYAGITLTPTIGTPVSGEFTPVTVSAVANGGSKIASVSIVYRTMIAGTTPVWVTNALTLASGQYKGEIPPLPVATVEYYATATDQAGQSYDSTQSSFEMGDIPTSDRYWDFSNAVSEGGGSSTNFYYDLGDGRRWTASGVFIGKYPVFLPPGGTIPSCVMQNWPNESKVNVTSPHFDGGVGTIYFSSKMHAKGANGAIAVQKAYVDEPTEDEWETCATFEYNRTMRDEDLTCHAEPIVLNDYNVKRIRILRSQANDYSTMKSAGYILLDNIAISRPPARVEMEELLRNPGYPSRDQFTKMRVKVTDVNPSAPTLNRRVQVWYKWTYAKTDYPSPAGWQHVDMTPVGDDIYEGTIATQKVGFINYYYKCNFDGYYYQRDPDGPVTTNTIPNTKTDVITGIEPMHSEKKSPAYWANGETRLEPPKAFSQYEVRPYRSEYGNVAMISEPATTTVSNMMLVGDEVWQAVTLVTGVTNLTWKFVGYDRYTDGAEEFQKEPVVWGDDNQAFINPPLGGFVEVGAEKGIQAELEYNGFLLMRFSTTNLDYMVKRAVWQDFDEWQASQDYFEESLGLYATTPYSVDFDNWTSDGYIDRDGKGADFQIDTPSVAFSDFDTFTDENWIRSKSRIIQERKIDNKLPANQAVDIQRGGFIGNSGYSITYGLSRFSYRVRSSLADDRWALYTGGEAWTLPKTIKPTFYIAERADSEHYLGLIFCYRDGKWGETPGYYELRFIQASCEWGQDNWRRVELWRQDPGADGPVQVGKREALYFGKFTATTQPEIKVSEAGGTVTVTVTVPQPNNPTTKDTIEFTDSRPGELAKGGTIGFGSYDASPMISNILVDGQKVQMKPANWYLGGKRRDNPGKTRWEFNGGNLTRAIPRQSLSIYCAEQIASENTPDSSKLRLKNAGIFVDSLQYQSKKEIFNAWDRTFVQLRYVSGEGNIVVDDVRNDPWRATTRAFDNSEKAMVDDVYYYDWTDIEKQQNVWLADNNGWTILEGWTTNTFVGSEVIFDRSRANTNLVQGLLTPVLTNGLGSVTFTYRVTGQGQAVYAVERTAERMIDTWETVAVYTNSARESGSRYTKIATTMKGRGRIRIRLLDETSKSAALHIDNVIAKDYPPRDNTTWLAYNARITDKIDDPTLIYNGTGKSAFLNNDTRKDVVGTEVLQEHEPFIQSPEVGTGIGEISFVYRPFTPGQQSEIIVKVAPSENIPESEWKVVTNLTVSGDASYIQFSDPTIFDIHDKVLRIYAKTGSPGRFAIDNILVTEPVRAGYEIFDVRLLPEQPISGKNTTVEAEIGRFMMDPKDIELYVSYRLGADDWGYTNWWKRADSANRARLYRVGPEGSRLYRTADNLGIPASATDDIVQYVVWGIHSEIDQYSSDVIFQGTNTFANPEWYGKFDLNEKHASEGWSPYYMTYSCAPGQVWVNEFNYSTVTADKGKDEYIEIAAPASVSLNGWKIAFYTYKGHEIENSTLTLTNAAPVKGDENGWRFYVIGTKGMKGMDQSLPYPSPYGTKNPGYFDHYGAGIKLYRNNGHLEQKVCWGEKKNCRPLIETYHFDQMGYKSGSTDSLSLISNTDTNGEYYAGSLYSDFNWKTLGHTPGMKNYIEGVGNKQIFLPFISGGGETESFWIDSIVWGPGKQNGATDRIYISCPRGSGYDIQYVADNFARLTRLTVDGTVVTAAANQKTYTYVIPSLQKNMRLEATFEDYNPSYPDVPVEWLRKYDEDALAKGDQDPYSVEDEYLLGLDPTADSTVDFIVSSVDVGDKNVKVTVELDRQEKNSSGTLAPVSGSINGLLRIYSASSLGDEFSPVLDIEKNKAFLNTTKESFDLPLTTGPFFKAVIDK